MNISSIQQTVTKMKDSISKVIVGKEDVIELLLIALISSGHILIEDVPGTGKTKLAKALAKSLDCSFNRVQFTPDLLPSDLSGINYYNQKSGNFEFRSGPVFTNILLADEINRATPRTQSSLLECMEEKQVTIDGKTHILEKPFMVIATQNPVETLGTFQLPEAQMDRFLMKIKMGYPTLEEGRAILKRFKAEDPLDSLEPVITQIEILEAQELFKDVYIDNDLIDYILKIAEGTSLHEDVLLGISPRGSQALLKASQVKAVIEGRDYVTPDDIKHLVKPVISHRLITRGMSELNGSSVDNIITDILEKISVPTENKLVK